MDAEVSEQTNEGTKKKKQPQVTPSLLAFTDSLTNMAIRTNVSLAHMPTNLLAHSLHKETIKHDRIRIKEAGVLLFIAWNSLKIDPPI